MIGTANVTCIMPTANRAGFVPGAIAGFLAQDHADSELLILDNGADSIADLVPTLPRIRYIRETSLRTLGALRNRACELTNGAFIFHWDDDDWYPADRISRQLKSLVDSGAEACGSSRVYFSDAARGQAWEYVWAGRQPWICGSTLAYRREAWRRRPFPEVREGEDTRFVWAQPALHLVDLADPALCVATIHGGNTSRKRPQAPLWRPVDPALIKALVGRARSALIPIERSLPAPAKAEQRPRALLALGGGIGDIIRATPLIRVLHALGHSVELLLACDYPQVVTLFEGAAEIARVTVCAPPNPRGGNATPKLDSRDGYTLACFTHWAAPLAGVVQARQRQVFDARQWLAEGDTACVARMARALGWTGDLPPPLAVASARRFGLVPGTLAIHGGCKAGWPWKKWHGYAELAECFEQVVIVGSAEDRDMRGTYFGKGFAWPAHVRDYSGQLDLADTAALLSQCAAVVGNDSGLLQLAAALGRPCFPIFGITSPQRELMRLPNVTPITKGLACEAACRRQPWGRRDCEQHLACLKTLDAAEVFDRITENKMNLPVMPTRAGRGVVQARASASARLTVAVRLSGGIGDVLLAAVLVRALHEALGDPQIDVHYHHVEVAKFVFRDARYARAVQPTSSFALAQRSCDLAVSVLQFVHYELRNPARLAGLCPDFAPKLELARQRFEGVRGLHERHPQLDGFWARLSVREGRGVLANLGHLGALPIDAETPLPLSPDPQCWPQVEQLLGGASPYLTIHDGFDNNHNAVPGSATKCWPLDRWAALVAALKSAQPALRIVQLGGNRSRAIPGVDLNLVGRTSLGEAAWLLKGAALHVDTDSGLVHLARALHTRSLVLFGPTNRDYYGHARNRNLAPQRCGDCWWSTPDWLSRCPRGQVRPECMDSIAAVVVAGQALELLAERPVASYEASECRLYDGALCRERADQLAQLFACSDLEPVPISAHAQQPRNGVYLHASKQWEYLYVLEALEAHFGADRRDLRIADVGGGRGALAPYLCSLGHEVEVHDRDYLWDHGGDPAVEARYRRWAGERGYRAEFGSIFNLPLEDESCDAVVSVSVVEHLPQKALVLREALRVLKPGGLLVLTFDFALRPQAFEDELRREIFSPARLREALAQIGVEAGEVPAEAVEHSVRAIQQDAVLGIPSGMTVGGIVLRKLLP